MVIEKVTLKWIRHSRGIVFEVSSSVNQKVKIYNWWLEESKEYSKPQNWTAKRATRAGQSSLRAKA
jgi:hypothetical protein